MKKFFKFISNNQDKIIYICMSIMVVNLIFYILFGCKALMNSDSTFFVDYSLEQIETKSIFPNTWVHTNDFWFYSLLPVMTPLIKMGVDFFLSRQIAVLVQTIVFFIILYDFYKKVFDDKKGMIIMFLIFLSGVSGQFMSEMYADATYGTVVFYMLLELWLFIKYVKSDYSNKKYLIFFTTILALLTGCSFRFPIYIGAPIICVLVYYCWTDNIKKKYVKPFACICGAVIIGVLINAFLKSQLLYVNNYEEAFPIIEYKQFNANIGKSIHDYLFISGATGKSVHSLTLHLTNDIVGNSGSPLIVLTFVKFIYAIVMLLIPFMLFRKLKSLSDEEKTLLIYVSSFAFIMFFFLIVGDLAWWHRYMFTVVFALNLLWPMFYKYYFSKKKNNRIIFNIVFTLVIASSFIFTVNSYINIRENRLRRNDYQYLADYFEDHHLNFGYAIADIETNLFRTLTNGKVHVLRISYDGKGVNNWIISKRWYEKGYYEGKVFFYRLKEASEKELKRTVELEKLANDKVEFGQFVIFLYDDNNTILDYFGDHCDYCIDMKK